MIPGQQQLKKSFGNRPLISYRGHVKSNSEHVSNQITVHSLCITGRDLRVHSINPMHSDGACRSRATVTLRSKYTSPLAAEKEMMQGEVQVMSTPFDLSSALQDMVVSNPVRVLEIYTIIPLIFCLGLVYINNDVMNRVHTTV